MEAKPFSQASENNKKPILEVLQKLLVSPQSVLEIGSGSGQHSVYFAQHLPHIKWHCSDQSQHLPGILAWHQQAHFDNLIAPVDLTINAHTKWPQTTFGSIFTANTVHIMSWQEVEIMFKGVGQLLLSGGLFIQYGPIKIAGKFTSESNQKFEQWLKLQGEHMGIRDLNELENLGINSQLNLKEQIPMPANNFILVWEKS